MSLDPADGRAYAELASVGPHGSGLGYAFISLVQPHRGYELAYTRWYEDDHFYSGAMAFPWWFAGRRWIATAELRAARFGSGDGHDLDEGWTLGTYWITPGRLVEQARWLEASVARLRTEGRMFDERTHVMTGYFAFAQEWQRAGHEPRAIHALNHSYGGLALEIIDGPPDGWLPDFVAGRLDRAEAEQCIAFTPVPWPGAGATSWFDYAAAKPARVVLVWLLAEDPRLRWLDSVADHAAEVIASGADLAFLGGFLPTLPGTRRYLDELH